MKPGDDGCLISEEGAAIYETGMVVSPKNVPEVGESIHAVFDYYGGDPEDADAWYNWTDGEGAYTVSE